MSFSSRSSGKRHYGHKHKGSNYYKREGLLSKILKVFGLFSNSSNKYNKNNYHNPHYSHSNHYSDQKHYPGRSHHRRRNKSSWS